LRKKKEVAPAFALIDTFNQSCTEHAIGHSGNFELHEVSVLNLEADTSVEVSFQIPQHEANRDFRLDVK